MTDITEAEVMEGAWTAGDMERGVTVIEPSRLSSMTPLQTIGFATQMADALKDIIRSQGLYTHIGSKDYPHVEAWMTIGRMDNVVAQEESVVPLEGGGFEAVVVLVRLSDGAHVGRGSAWAGTPDDSKGKTNWATAAKPVQRSMAVTRATSRAFRQQYGWIMALAGYEPTPAEEMPHDNRPLGQHTTPPDRPQLERRADGLTGTAAKGKPPVDLQLRQTPDGPAWGFKLAAGNKGYQALAIGELADALSLASEGLLGATVTVWGRIEMVPWDKKQDDGTLKAMPPYARIAIERVQTPDWTLPAEATEAPTVEQDDPFPEFQ